MRITSLFDRKNMISQKQSLVEVVGYRRVLIENHTGIALYSSNEIQIKVSYGRVCIMGSEMYLVHVGREQLVIVGCVDSLQIIRR